MKMIGALLEIVRAYIPHGSARLQTSSQLASLPAELLTEVLKLLTWKDILQLRVTCKLLAGPTKTRAIWAHLVVEYISCTPYPPRLERPIDMHTSEELERLLLLWNSADAGWKRSDGHPARERVFAAYSPEIVHLVKGGRWLLITSVQTGAVTCYDLDAEIIVGVPLIPDQIAPYGELNVMISIDFHNQSPLLSFTIALSLSDRSQNPDSFERYPYETIQIWEVRLLLNESQKGVGLKARQLASFPHRPAINAVMALSLLGSTIAFRAYPPDENTAYIYVVDWVHANQNPTMYAWRMLDMLMGSESRVQLLPNSRLLILRDNTISLSDYSAVAETMSMVREDENSPQIDHSWTTNVEAFDPLASSTHILGSGSVRLVFNVQNTLHSMIIDTTPISRTRPPPIVMLMNTSFLRSFRPPALGCNRGIFVDRHHDAWLLHYALPNADGIFGGASYIRKHISPELSPTVIRGQIMDEDSGRVVNANNSQITVIDFALIFQ